MNRRRALGALAALVCTNPFAESQAAASFAAIPRGMHEAGMRLAIAQGRRNPRFPFGAVITQTGGGEALAQGVNNSRSNPTLHGEIVCMNEYVARHGNQGWADAVLYTTAEPCAMCMSALIWAGIGGVVYASSIATVDRAIPGGAGGINLSARTVADAAPGYRGTLLGGVLAEETDAMFLQRPRD